jgi:two-component system NtrC family sensor kinase
MLHQPLPQHPRPYLLVVDDEPQLGEYVRRVLRRDCDVDLTTDPERALQAIQTAPRIDLVLTDLMMRPITGVHLQALAVAARPELVGRFIFMTGGATTEATRSFLDRLPSAQLLLKPFSPSELEAAVQGLLATTTGMSRGR